MPCSVLRSGGAAQPCRSIVLRRARWCGIGHYGDAAGALAVERAQEDRTGWRRPRSDRRAAAGFSVATASPAPNMAGALSTEQGVSPAICLAIEANFGARRVVPRPACPGPAAACRVGVSGRHRPAPCRAPARCRRAARAAGAQHGRDREAGRRWSIRRPPAPVRRRQSGRCGH